MTELLTAKERYVERFRGFCSLPAADHGDSTRLRQGQRNAARTLAKGLIFITLEDETGHSRVIIKPDFYDKNRHDVLYAKFVQVWGTVQNQDGIVHLVAKAIRPLAVSAAETSSHDFH